MDRIRDLWKTKRTAVILTTLSAAVLFSAVCFYDILPDDIKPGKHNPQKVATVNAVASSYDSVTVAWRPAPNAKTYKVFRSDDKRGSYEECGEVEDTTFTDSKLETDREYWYMVRSEKDDKFSRYSKRVSATPKLDKPELTGLSTEEGAELTVTEVPGATGYIFYRDGQVFREQPMNICLDGSLKEKEKHKYQVVAVRKQKTKEAVSAKSNRVEAGKITVKITLDNVTAVGDMLKGTSVEMAGTLKSNVKMKAVEVGVMDDKGEKWIDKQKYENKKVDSKSFDLKAADSELKFADLKAGKYRYRIQVNPEGGKMVVVVDQQFKVEDNPALGAVEWAINIANDNSFNYGTKGPANHGGCYFCKTFGAKKRHLKRIGQSWSAKWEKTYCCNPFIFAAYAHGAKDPATLASCQRGGCGGMAPSDWTRLGSYELVGTCKSVPYSDLKPGDIIMSNTNENGWTHHVWMFIGDGKLVESSGGGWDAGSIAVKDIAAQKYSRYSKHSGTYVVRYKGPDN